MTRCFVAGLVAILPIGGLVFLLVKLEQALRPPLSGLSFYFPGMAILATLLAIYLLGLTVSSVIGRWFWRILDRILENVPGLAVLYATLKQILGYGSGKDAMFHKVVLVRDDGTGALELGLLTEELTLPNEGLRWLVFMPGSPNPAQGRLVIMEKSRCIETKIAVDAALKALLSTGKMGLGVEEVLAVHKAQT